MHIFILLQGLFNAGVIVRPYFWMRLIVSRDKISSQESTFLMHLCGLISNTHFLDFHPLYVPEGTICRETISSKDFRHKMIHHITSGPPPPQLSVQLFRHLLTGFHNLKAIFVGILVFRFD